MLGRLLLGAFVGGLVGALAAAVLLKGLALASVPALVLYLTATAVGAVTGLVAGKPIWSSGGKIEAGLKSLFGAVLAAGALYALRRFVHTSVDLSTYGAGVGEIGELPAVALPLIAATLGGFFGLDNTPEAADAPRTGVRVAKDVTRTEAAAEDDEATEEPATRKAKR